jgi:type 1 glutamine amidotransferase
VHAANNSFPQWPAYNDMIGVGGWGGRTEKSGPYLRLREGKFTTDMTPGRGGSHGPKHPFVVEIRNAEHPITAGLPPRWMHASDELYDRLRGPAKDVTVLASAFADSAKGGSGEHEPMLMVIPYGKGRVFHTPMGHDSVSMTCVGFQTVLTRGTEWAATGKVTIPVPADFPTADQIRQRE